MKKTGKVILTIGSALLLVFLILLIPDSPPGETIHKAGEKPFTWNKDDLWKGLEKTFREETMADPALRDAQLMNLQRMAETVHQTYPVRFQDEFP